MEEAKAAAYYDELTRKGEGAARFKRGLGFSSNDDDNSAPSRGSALASSTSFLSNFVKSSSDPTQISKYEKEAQLQSIQNKLKKNKVKDEPSCKVSGHGDSHRHRRRSRSRDRDRDRERNNSRRSRSRSRSRERYTERKSDRRNRSRSPSLQGRRRSEKSSRNGDAAPARDRKEMNYSKLIRGYENMTAAEKAKARTKLQLNETAEKDTTKGMGSGWERFEFDKDAPLDDEEIEAAEDDVALVKHIGQSFRFSAVEAKKEDQIKAAHDAAMFGAPILGSMISDSEPEADNNEKESIKTDVAASLLSEKVLAKQQGSWRDRARKTKE